MYVCSSTDGKFKSKSLFLCGMARVRRPKLFILASQISPLHAADVCISDTSFRILKNTSKCHNVHSHRPIRYIGRRYRTYRIDIMHSTHARPISARCACVSQPADECACVPARVESHDARARSLYNMHVLLYFRLQYTRIQSCISRRRRSPVSVSLRSDAAERHPQEQQRQQRQQPLQYAVAAAAAIKRRLRCDGCCCCRRSRRRPSPRPVVRCSV